ncbi:aminodeoxychorismate synthase component I [Nonomuraea sp. NPDC003804]|uniref:aminodeoxychorismate synthase component I n=1 Tax=Nonomuraea sp. NPDC003804 TaxID=3154547 RepID=UPI0033B73264
MRTLLIDNYDSYTFNLFQMLAEANGCEPIVIRNDSATWRELSAMRFDNIVLSPGPGHPGRPGDFGVCAEVLRQADVPVLGVCLGHQGMAAVAGGMVELAPEPMHGRLSRVWHDGRELFAGVPAGFRVVRYHSWIVSEPLPASLEAVAWTADGLVMALRHRFRPQWGVQFHPESIATEHGMRLLENFRDLSRPAAPIGGPRPLPADASRPEAAPPPYRAHVATLPEWLDPETVFSALHETTQAAFWLDSSRAEPGQARFSFLGAHGGPLSRLVKYRVERKEVHIHSAQGKEVQQGTLFDYLDRSLARGVAHDELPFDFVGGFVGYFGYELKADCGGSTRHRSPYPDACLVFADRFVAFDHEERRVYLVALSEDGTAEAAQTWFSETVRLLAASTRPTETDPPLHIQADHVQPSVGRAAYLAAVRACLEEIRGGESYEICLTGRVRTEPLEIPSLDVYRVLRRINPAPYAAYLRFDEVEILSSSPERFLRVDGQRWIESKPIKGTLPRAADAQTDLDNARALTLDEKTRAENLMIVDLVRNDLGRVSAIGTVHVPELMGVESYETVHQLVSTIRGRLRPELTSVDALRAAFPAGSMTGAPKLRTMQIIDRLEDSARGVYAGSIGFLSLNGTADLSVVIRTVVADPAGTTIGTGGAIVAQSDPDAEYDEAVLKATAPARAMAIARHHRDNTTTYAEARHA